MPVIQDWSCFDCFLICLLCFTCETLWLHSMFNKYCCTLQFMQLKI